MSWSLCSGGSDTFGAPFVSLTFHRDVGTEQYDKVTGAPEGIAPPNILPPYTTPIFQKGVHTESMRELLISDPQSLDPDQPVRIFSRSQKCFFKMKLDLILVPQVGFIYLFEATEGSDCPSSGEIPHFHSHYEPFPHYRLSAFTTLLWMSLVWCDSPLLSSPWPLAMPLIFILIMRRMRVMGDAVRRPKAVVIWKL